MGQMVRDTRQHPCKTPNAATPGIYGRKKYCTYWIRTGNCDYIQEGCKYLHVIPDEETRLRIGIRDMPRWAREEIPAPENQFFPKRQTADGQNWRRHSPVGRMQPLGRMSELPEVSRAQACPALPPATTPASAGQSNVQNGNKDTRFLNLTAQRPSNTAEQTDQQTRSGLNNGRPKAITRSAASAAAESYQRQMQSTATTHQSMPPTPTSAPLRYPPNVQPPIGRPIGGSYTAPDRLTDSQRVLNLAQNPAPSILWGRGINRDSSYSALPSPNATSTRSSPLFGNNQPRTPIDAKFANMTLGSRDETAANSTDDRSTDLVTGSIMPSSPRPFGSRYSGTFQSANYGDLQANSHVGSSLFNSPVVMHRRHFLRTGESPFVPASAAEKDVAATQTANATQQSRSQHRTQR